DYYCMIWLNNAVLF
nr:immunoglobulin light chain junction region [Macaca mulatta]MOW04162.1 immunoglobulin light chain junction region [Macaca mulatta]MOW04274.1 immunoglobulin light chain junction region [Macaca mulatta]MOW04321.1 immunoglobulin light chain junction region [Macaca mulatta]MOW04391.1 immunoglobulin light chain junction region [Macaca mulatta]